MCVSVNRNYWSESGGWGLQGVIRGLVQGGLSVGMEKSRMGEKYGQVK